MSDDQDKELDRLGNNGNESPDNPAKNEENPTLIAGLPKPKPRALYPVNGGKPSFTVIPGRKPGVTPQPSPTPGERPANSRGNFAPGATQQPSSTPNPNSQGSQPSSNISEQRLGAATAEALGLDRPPVWWDPLGQMQNTERRVNAEASRRNNPATPQIPPSRATPGLGGIGRDAININREIQSSQDNLNNYPPSSSTTGLDSTGREIMRRNQELQRAQESLQRNPTTTPTRETPAPTLPNPFGDPNLPWNKPTPAQERRREPGGSPQRKPKKKTPQKTTEVPEIPERLEPFDPDRFRTEPQTRPWNEGQEQPAPATSPQPKKDDPNWFRRGNTPAKRKTPAEQAQERRDRQRTGRPMIQDGPGQTPRPMTDQEIRMTTKSPSNPTPTPTNPPAPTPSPAQKPASPAAKPASRAAKKKAVEAKIKKLKRQGDPLNIERLPAGLEKELGEAGYTIARGKITSIRYRGPGKSNLHIESNGHSAGTIAYGPPLKIRNSSSAKAEKNVLAGTGVQEIPAGYENNHIIPVNVWDKLELTQQYDKNSGITRIDDAGNLVIMRRSKTATRNQSTKVKRDVATLQQQDKMLTNLNHRGSHDGWDERVEQAFKDETDALRERFDGKSLDQIPPEEIEKSVKKVQAELNQELQKYDQMIREGNVKKLPKWIQRDPDPNNKNEWRLSEQPEGQQTKPANLASAVPYDQQTLITINNLAQAMADKIVAANTFSFQLGQVYMASNRQAYAQTLASAITQQMQGKESIQGNLFQAKRVGQNIKITNPDGKDLATIYPDNKIAMAQALSDEQVQALSAFQASVAAEQVATVQKNNGPSLG
jgi:hypothetical protein